MSYDEMRTKTTAKAKRIGLAEPVAQLIATTYEPRIDGRIYSAEFESAVNAAKRALKKALAEVTPNQGGRAETVALRVAKALREQAEDAGAPSSVELIDAALDRCRNGITAGQDDESQVHLIEPERVLSRSGRPIGLWR